MKRSKDSKQLNGGNKHSSSSGRQHYVKRKKRKGDGSPLVVEVVELLEAQYAVLDWAGHQV
jgi:hypothetical protein